jgi:hypothetical protein
MAATLLGSALLLASRPPHVRAQEPAAVEFFEKEVRPLLVEKCQNCHNPKKSSGGLRLTDHDSILKGGDSGPAVVPGSASDSLLIRAVSYLDEPKMPPKKKLADADIARLKQWVVLGAPWSMAVTSTSGAPNASRFQVTDAQRRWWAYQPVRDRQPPLVKNAAWPQNGIDSFVAAALEARGLQPAGPAERRTWIRRATLDLIGLPPAPEDVEAFVSDESPAAFVRVVDRLLASPAYGQRWARHWLDVARYTDYHDGHPNARVATCEPLEAWRYRDWVVRAFNRELPFDQFITHQIAGDLIQSPDGQEYYADGLIATTFLSNGSWDRGDADKEKMVSDMVDDQVDTIGKAFLGLTLGCARCHNHKFDPVSQDDYYALAGMFYSTHILKELGAKGEEYTLNRVPLAPRSCVVKRDQQLRRLDEIRGKLAALDKKSPGPATGEPSRLALVRERDALERALLPEPALVEAAQEGGTPGGLFPGIQDVPIHIRGSYTRLGPIVPRRLPQFLAGNRQQPISHGSGRLELARWIASPKNPLTARVIVNRVWQGHFGAGLVSTPSNFGMTSEPPSHPDLLDWLAARFVDNGWSLKTLHRHIMLSAVYQQSSAVAPDRLTADPENRWMSRFTARRLEAEAIRDTMLCAAGQLDRAIGGPASPTVNTNRCSLYVQTARWDKSTFATLFDAANPDASDEKRTISTVAPQALFLLNHEFTLTQAGRLADRLTREAPVDETARIQRAYRLLYARLPTALEIDIARQVLVRSAGYGSQSAWRDLAHVLLCCNELVYLD